MAKPKRNIHMVAILPRAYFLVVDGNPELLTMIKDIEGVHDVVIYGNGRRANVEINTCYDLLEIADEIEELDTPPIPEAFLETGEAK